MLIISGNDWEKDQCTKTRERESMKEMFKVIFRSKARSEERTKVYQSQSQGLGTVF